MPAAQKRAARAIEVHWAGTPPSAHEITCQSCQSKYNVADEKVQGKVVKIRCRKCGATIVVNGTAAGATNGSSPSPAKSAAGPGPKPAAEATPWHVNVAENDQRTMSLAELVDAHASGLVTHDTFVWIESLAKQVALADVRANRATVYAPIDGRILNIMAHAGELVGPSPILTMGNTEKMRAVAEVYETDTGRIEIGQTAQVTSRTLTTPVTGHVVEIGQMIFKNDVLNVDPAAKSDARVVEVRIELDDAERTQYLTNHTVDVIIHVDEAVGAKVSRVSTMR